MTIPSIRQFSTPSVISRVIPSLAVLLAVHSLTDQATAQYERFADYHVRAKLEVELLNDLRDGCIDDHTLIRASLIAAGHVDEAAIHAIGVRYQGYVARCGQLLATDDEFRDQAATLFRFMHAEILRGRFEPGLYDVARTISDGHSNCLTATILFQSLCQRFSLPAQAVWQPTHVCCWLSESEYEGLAVETTTPKWNDALRARESIADVPARFLTQTELIAKVFYNRGVEALHRRWFSTALSATWASCLLDSDDGQAQMNLRACLNNWALDAALAGDFATARKLLETGMRFDPEHAPFARNQAFVRQMSKGT